MTAMMELEPVVSGGCTCKSSDTGSQNRSDRYRVSVDEYVRFRRDGFLAVRNLVSREEVAELRQHTEDLMQGRLPEQKARMSNRDPKLDTGESRQELEAPPEGLSPEQRADYFLRLHMLHRRLALHERYLLHPRVLDVLEMLIGPDVLALQTMLFLKGPGKPGQGWHQDSYYIPSIPDTLCGAWLAIDPCDELNGAMWFAKGSQNEPIYPPRSGYGYGDRLVKDIFEISGASNPDDEKNELTPVADKYDQILVCANPGDVVFFGGHVLHRSKKNFTTDRFRRSFVSHYCNARAFTRWNDAYHDDPLHPTVVEAQSGLANGVHILARGDTHLPFAKPRFGTPCAALLSAEERKRGSKAAGQLMGDVAGGLMG